MELGRRILRLVYFATAAWSLGATADGGTAFDIPCAAGSTCQYAGAVENSDVTAACTSGKMTVASAEYVAQNKSASCLTYAASKCNGQSTCTLNFNNSSCGGDPQYGVVKNGTLNVTCVAPIPATASTAFGGACAANSSCTFTGASENTDVKAACTTGTITVKASAYQANDKSLSCLNYAAATCNNKATCTLNFNNSSCGGDPLYGIMKTANLNFLCQAMQPAPTAPIANKSYRVMPLGDSITAGVGDNSQPQVGYRGPLYDALSAEGYHLTMVGEHNATDSRLANEGNPGWTIQWTDIYAVSGNNGMIATYKPDVAIIILGTNDIEQQQDLSNASLRMSKIISDVQAFNPAVKIIVGSIPPLADPNLNSQVNTFNTSIKNLVQQLAASNQPVYFADLNAALMTSDLINDGIHPNHGGYAKIASVLNQVFQLSIAK